MNIVMQLLAAALIQLFGALALHAEDELSDPTRPFQVQAPTPAVKRSKVPAPAFSLSGVRVDDEGNGWALINGTMVPLHGRVGDATLVHIDSTYVVLDHNGQKRRLEMLPPAMHKSVAHGRLRTPSPYKRGALKRRASRRGAVKHGHFRPGLSRPNHSKYRKQRAAHARQPLRARKHKHENRGHG